MSATFRPFWRVRQFLGLDNPLPHPKPAAAPTPAPRIQPTMKNPKIVLPIKTFGSGKEAMDIYGAIPLSRERIQVGAQEAKMEAEAHEKEIQAPILSFQGRGAAIGTSLGGIGLTDQEFIRRTARFENEQRILNSGRSIDEILPNANGTIPIKVYQN